ncbi:MAG: hypothetical protein E7582_03770 [Ruminococcaceae bacterium]|nr:hypothetical protein [Oscillospiraceae bacterium]
MTNNSNENAKNNLQKAVANILGQNSEINGEIKNLINSLSEDDIKKISSLVKNRDLQKLASSFMDSKKPKE